jgi:D-inositol-3-phosphate glycosyltransferase
MTDPLPNLASFVQRLYLEDPQAVRLTMPQQSNWLISQVADALRASETERQVGTPASGADIVVGRGDGDPPLAIEISLWQYGSLAKNLANRINELLGRSVRIRREFPDGAQLSLLIVLLGDPETDWTAQRADSTSTISRTLDRLPVVLSERRDGAGFDNLVLGLASSHGSQWISFEGDSKAPENSPDFSSVISRLGQSPPAGITEVPKAENPAKGEAMDGPPRILLVADEWRSHKGGISTFNRELAAAFATVGCEVHVALPRADPDERDSASETGVTLVVPPAVPGLAGYEILLTRPRFENDEYRPDVIVGHGRLLGPYAYALQNTFFASAKRLHFVHTDAEMLESAKEEPGGTSRMLTAEKRKAVEVELAISANLVAGVGPLLAQSIRDEMRGWHQSPPRVMNFIPGLRNWGGIVDPNDVPDRRQVLLIARAEDIHSKGIDIAVSAMMRAIDRFPGNSDDLPSLVIRGVPTDEASNIKNRLESIASPHVQLILRRYSSEESALKRDLWQSRVVIMPSRHEGFGLAAYEAISAGVPVLVSQDSGLARLLKEKAPDGERPVPREILPVRGDDDAKCNTWGDALYETLCDPVAAFSRAAHVREVLASEISWENSIQQALCFLGYHWSHECKS